MYEKSTFSYLISESKAEVIHHITMANWALSLLIEPPFDPQDVAGVSVEA